MKIRFTSIVWDDAPTFMRDVAKDLERSLSTLFRDDDFGSSVDQVTIVSVAVSSDPAETEKFVKANEKTGYFIDPFSKLRIKYISFALIFDPEKTIILSAEEYKKKLCYDLSQHLDNPRAKLSKGFDYTRFCRKFQPALDILSNASFSGS